MPTTDKKPSGSFWSRWMKPHLGKVLKHWSLWGCVLIWAGVTLWPKVTPWHLPRSVSVETLGSAVIPFAAIGLGIALALGALVVTLPDGKFRCAMHTRLVRGKPTPYQGLAFMAFWAGAANLAAATIALFAIVIAGPYRVLRDDNLWPAIASGLVLASAIYALLQMFNALVALLENAGLSQAFEGPNVNGDQGQKRMARPYHSQ